MATQPTPSIVTPTVEHDADHIEPLNAISGFDLPSIPTPDASSALSEIVDFIDVDLRLARLDIERLFWKKELRGLCDEFDWPYVSVLGEMRRQMFLASPLNAVAPEDIATTPRGIVVNKKAQLAGAHLAPICPFKLRFISAKNFRPYTLEDRCGSPWCLTCGPTEADKLLHRLAARVRDLDRVYVTFCPWNPGLSTRMSQRRHQTGMNTLTYRRNDDLVFFVSDKPLQGDAPPTSSRPMTPDDALDWFADIAFVPGRKKATWSKGWAWSEPGKSGDGDGVDVGHLDDNAVKDVLDTFAKDAEVQFGVDIPSGYLGPKDVHPHLVALLRKLVAEAGG